MHAASQVYIASLVHLAMVSKGQLLHKRSDSVVHGWSGSSCNGMLWPSVTLKKYFSCTWLLGYLVVSSNEQPLHLSSISVGHGWSGSSCNGQ